MGPVDFVRLMEEALIGVCGRFGVRAGRVAGLTGVWCGGQDLSESDLGEQGKARKIGAIGIHVARGITSHGFAFNVTTDLRDFALIVPCGIADHAVTSLEHESQQGSELPSLETVAREAAGQFGLAFDQQLLAVESLETLRAQAAAAAPAFLTADPHAPESVASEFPAEDTPMRVPAEVERLMDSKGIPIRA